MEIFFTDMHTAQLRWYTPCDLPCVCCLTYCIACGVQNCLVSKHHTCCDEHYLFRPLALLAYAAVATGRRQGRGADRPSIHKRPFDQNKKRLLNYPNCCVIACPQILYNSLHMYCYLGTRICGLVTFCNGWRVLQSWPISKRLKRKAM